MRSVPAWIANVVLKVADDRIVPVEEVDRAIRPDIDIRRTKVRIGREHDRLQLGTDEAGAFVIEFVLQDALESDHVGHQQIALVVLGEVPAGKDCRAGTGTGALLIKRRRSRMLLRIFQVAGKQCRVVGHCSGAVVHEVLAPTVEHMAVWIGEVVGDVSLNAPGTGLEAPDAAILVAYGPIDRFDL